MLNTINLTLLGTLHFLESPASCIGFTKINNTIKYLRFFFYFIELMDLLFNKIWMIYNHHKIHYKKITQWHIVFLKNNVVKIGAICVVHPLSILPCILSDPDALWIFIFCSNLLIPFSVMIISGICGCWLCPFVHVCTPVAISNIQMFHVFSFVY